MDTALPQKFPFILDRNLAKANCAESQVCMSCDTVVLAFAPSSYSITHYSAYIKPWVYLCQNI